MRYVVAISGGVDSVVLLDMFAKRYRQRLNGRLRIESCVVAHFDHGIRPDSARDMAFVRDLAKQYGLRFVTKREKLGPDASEELARSRRYAFLQGEARRLKATIVTAHHADDVIETIAINCVRGTGWRGLAVLDSPGVVRPLADMRKSDIIEYATKRGLTWREDKTNSDPKYLRNDIRQRLAGVSDDTVRLAGMYRQRQRALKRMIEEEAARLVGSAPYSRYFFTMIPENVAVELLRTVFVNELGESPTIPVRRRVLHAIKTYTPGKRFIISHGIDLHFTKTEFVVEHRRRVLS